ncbi:MAG: hypothetical protein Q8N23_13365 [Archangium sp.]|nr:hypothetical protein [Archangium sp.]MDP3153661.1 hypothetical protein [Archangium sp.]MDP3569291.1 hypothetical protein [Archangium sp.]
MRCLSLLPCLALSACGDQAAPALAVVELAPVMEAVVEETTPAFEDAVLSLRVKQSTTVRSQPDERSAPLGVLAQDMRVTWRGAATGPCTAIAS